MKHSRVVVVVVGGMDWIGLLEWIHFKRPDGIPYIGSGSSIKKL